MESYGDLSVPTGKCVHFVDECPGEEHLREVANELRSKMVAVVYLDCAAFVERSWELPNAIGYLAGTDHPPYDEENEPYWLRWWDDMLGLGMRSAGLAIVLDNAHLIFATDRKFMTNLLESFLQGMRSWGKREVPYHLCFQMVPCPAVRRAFAPEERV